MEQSEKARAPKEKPFTAKVYDFFSGWLLAVILLSFLLALTYFGTMAQVEMGLYEASDKYFESLFLVANIWDVPILLPGVYLVSGLLFLNLLLGAIVRARKSWKRPGMLIAHGGILYILVAGFVSYHYTKEGNMVLYEGDRADEIYNLTEWSIEISKHDQEGAKSVVYLIGPDDLRPLRKEGSSRTYYHDEIPFELKVSGYQRNIANGNGQLAGLLNEEKARGLGIAVVEGFGLSPVKTNKNMEFNLPAAYVDVLRPNNPIKGLIVGAGPFSPRPLTININEEQWSIDLTRHRHTLPFGVQLEKFQKEDHPGTARAREYSSDVVKIENGELTDKVHISMNKPMRDGGYTLYQASWGPEGAGPGDRLYTSLAVSHNPADQWPKYGTYVIAMGMSIHFIQKLFAYLRRSTRSRNRKEESA